MLRFGQRRGRRSRLEQRADRLALVEPEGRDGDQADRVRRFGAERGHDLAAVGMAGHERRTALEAQDVAQAIDVVGERGQRELRRGDVEAVVLQALDDGAPTGSIRPGTMDEDEVRRSGHG
jgi:hypothetical protein